MKKVILILSLTILNLLAECSIEDIQIDRVGERSTEIHGVATCIKGEVLIKLYDGDTDKYVAHHRAVIRNGAFSAFFFKQPKQIKIRYSAKEW